MILLAVVLFAALSYAVTSSIRGGGKDASSENAEAAAAEILQWFTAVDNAVMRMHMNGIAYEDMSFGYDAFRYDGIALPSYMNNTRCTSDSCRIFKSAGGGAAPPSFSKYSVPEFTGYSTSSLKAGYTFSFMMMWPGAGTDLNDVVFSAVLSPEICTEVNRELGISSLPTITGSYVAAQTTGNWDNAAYTFTSNKQSLYSRDTYASATLGTGNGRYCYIYHVVIKR